MSRERPSQTIATDGVAACIGLRAEQLPGHDEGDAGRRRRVVAEEKRLRIWAREHRRLKEKLPGEDARGGEHTVAFDERTQRILRVTRPGSGGSRTGPGRSGLVQIQSVFDS